MRGQVPTVQLDSIILAGGLDLITPTLALKNGVARQSLNFECGVTGGYARIAGYERYDGHTSPSSTALQRYLLVVAAVSHTPVVGETLTSSGGASGTVAYVDSTSICVTATTGTYTVGHTVSIGGDLVGTLTAVYTSGQTPYQDTILKNAVADIYRSAIGAVPGSGPVRGVVEFGDTVYAFRNDAASPTVCNIYKSTTSGWTQVNFYKTVSFTLGGAAAPAEGGTLTQGSVTATLKRAVRRTGVWASNSAAGELIISAPAGGDFSSGAATIGSVNVTLSGKQTAITLLPSGKFEFVEANFYGQATSKRLYGCDGVNKGFEFDGDILVPITTGATTDTPTHVVAHKNHLFFAIGSSLMHSAPGLPYDWTSGAGAAEIATGDTVTGMVVMPGGTSTATLGVTSRNNTSILYGTGSSSWVLTAYNTGSGAIAYSAQNMAQTLLFDDRGAVSLQAALEYGNFNSTTLTNSVWPWVNERLNLFTYATLNRRKSQYRLFFSDGYGLYVTIVNGQLLGCMPVKFAHPVYCAYEGKLSTGEDVNFFGSTDGYVYQLDKGTSHDGTAIDYQLQLNYANAKSPRTLKRFRKASIELTTTGSAYASLSVGYILGYDSTEYAQASALTDDTAQVTASAQAQYVATSRWDAFTWDDFFWDSSGLQPLEIELDGTAENLSIFIQGTNDYTPEFTINSILVHFTPRRMMR